MGKNLISLILVLFLVLPLSHANEEIVPVEFSQSSKISDLNFTKIQFTASDDENSITPEAEFTAIELNENIELITDFNENSNFVDPLTEVEDYSENISGDLSDKLYEEIKNNQEANQEFTDPLSEVEEYQEYVEKVKQQIQETNTVEENINTQQEDLSSNHNENQTSISISTIIFLIVLVGALIFIYLRFKK